MCAFRKVRLQIMVFGRLVASPPSTRAALTACQGKKGTIVPYTGVSAPLCAPLVQRHVSSATKRGRGGRSSFSGVVATVFGATGFIGRYVVNRLGQMGSQVMVPYRGDELDYRHLKVMGDLGQILFLDYSLRDPASVRRVIQHSNVVINLVGRDYETRNFKFSDVHVEGARVIAEACSECGVKQLIHFSALNADKQSPSSFLRSKALGEEVVRESFPDAVIVRPSDVFGYEDRFLRSFASLRIFPFGLIPLLRGGDGVMKRPVHGKVQSRGHDPDNSIYMGFKLEGIHLREGPKVVDVASAILQMISEDSAKTDYELVGPKVYELPNLMRYCYNLMYRPCRIYSPPDFLLTSIAFILEQNPFIPYLTRDILKRLHMSNTLTPEAPGLEDLGISGTMLEEKAISILRMYRDSTDMNRPINEEVHSSPTTTK